MTIIRQMVEEDADAVRDVDALAFWTWGKQLRGEAAPMYRRTRNNVLACREKDPDGCFVAEEDGQVVGFIFSRTWGGVGWFGTFAVLPAYQGRGIGKQLITASLEYLRQEPDRLIGLETMSESAYNLGLYLGLRFHVRLPTLLLSKELNKSGADHVDLPRWSSTDTSTRKRWLVDLTEATGQIQPGLNYSKEIVSVARHHLGETLVLTDGATAIGMSIIGLVSAWDGWGEQRASIQVLALHPAHTNEQALRALTGAGETLVRACGKQVLTVPVNARHAWALQQLLQCGYRVERMAVRMVLQGTDNGPRTDHCVDFARWVG